MNQSGMCVPVFFYAYKPFLNKQSPEDSGFSVTVFENGAVVYYRFVNQNVCVDRCIFSLNPSVCQEYLDVLEGSQIWLRNAPANLRNGEQSVFASCFAFDGAEPIHIWNPELLVREPFGSYNGLWARRICLLFEEVTAVFARYGIHLALDNFYWNPALVSPVIRGDSGRDQAAAN